MPTDQFDFFGPSTQAAAPSQSLPSGFRYEPDVLAPADEEAVLASVRELPFRAFEFHGYEGKRRIVSFGWKYDFAKEQLHEASDIPDFLLSLREPVAAFAGMKAEALQQVLVTEYSPGAGIGWHKDKAVFGEVVGVSLLASCTFRLRRALEGGWERVNIVAAPRSAYLLSGLARTEWEHSIPPVEELRYSITFRNLRTQIRREERK